MRRALAFILVVVLVPGCTDAPGGQPSKSSLAPTASKPPDNTTVEGVLLQAPHLKVVGPATLTWDLSNGTTDKPQIATTLVSFGGLLDKYKSSNHAFDGYPDLVAFIPIASATGLSGCASTPREVKAYFYYRDGTGNNRFGNLTGDYAAGWYHVVVISTRPATVSISFETDKEARPRRLPAADPYVGTGAVAKVGGRELTHSIVVNEGAWFAWAAHRYASGGADGGRTQMVSIGDCATNSVTSTSPFSGGGGGGGNNQPTQRSITTSAAGTQASFDVRGKYTPTIEPVAPTETTLYAFWAWAKPVPVQAPSATPTPS